MTDLCDILRLRVAYPKCRFMRHSSCQSYFYCYSQSIAPLFGERTLSDSTLLLRHLELVWNSSSRPDYGKFLDILPAHIINQVR